MSWTDTYTSTLRQLSVPSLHQERVRLENSVKHLQRSNTELKQHESEADEDASWVQPIIQENEHVIAKQSRQIDLVKLELSSRVARSGNFLVLQPDEKDQESNGGLKKSGEYHTAAMDEDEVAVDTNSENGHHL